MADIRINSLPTTASASSSDDFLALDGATNGTRKLNAFSPTFGGNLTVSGTGTNSFSGPIAISASGTDAAGLRAITTSSVQTGYVRVGADTASAIYDIGVGGSAHSLTAIRDKLYTYANGAVRSTMDTSGNLVLTTGNLTVSGTGIVNSGLASGSTLFTTYISTDRAINFRNLGSGSDIWASNNARNAYSALSLNATTLALNADSGGNVLVGTTTDGGQKLQVSGTAQFTGNVNVYKTSGEAALQADYSTTHVKIFNDSSALGLYTNSWGGLLTFTKSSSTTTVEGQSIVLKPNGTTALTLDSSQNATFAGQTVNVSKSGNNPAYKATDGTIVTKLQSQSSGDTAGVIGTESNHTFKLCSNNTTALTIDTSQNATFAGRVRTTALGIGSAPNSYYTIFGSPTLTGNDNQAFLNASPTFDSGATGQGNVVWLQGRTVAASYTLTALSGIKIESPSLGASSSVTTVYGIRIMNQTGGTTNYAIYTDGGYIRFGSLPTSSAGLPSGTVWNDGGTLKIA